MKKILLIILTLVSVSVYAEIRCTTGSRLEDAALGIIGKADLADTGIGILPNSIVTDAMKKIAKDAAKVNDVTTKLQSFCNIFYGKDVIKQYFGALDLVFGATPLSPIISQYAKIGDKMIDAINQFSNNNGSNVLINESGVTQTVNVSLVVDRWWGYSKVSQSDIVKKNYIESAAIIFRGKEQKLITERPLSLEKDEITTLLKISELDVAETSINDVFVKIIWKTGQVSIVPLANGFVKFPNPRKIEIPFLIKDNFYSVKE